MARPLASVLRFLYRQSGSGDRTAPTDGDLLAGFVAGGDARAFDTLIERHGGLVWQTCRRLLADEGDAEDAFQATFLVLLRRAGSLDGSRSLAGWLYGVARRVALRARSRSARRRALERQEPDMDPAAAESIQPDDVRTFLDAELAELPDKYRAPLVLCYLEGKTNEEAARELGWPAGSMSSRLERGRELLRERLLSRGLGLSSAALAAALAENTAGAAPPSLAATTRLAASSFILGTGAAGGFSAATVALAEGVVRAMWISQLKWIAGVVLVSAAAIIGVTLGVHQALAGRNAALAPLPDVPARPADDAFAGAQRLALTYDRSTEPMGLKHALATVGQFPDDAYGKIPFDRRPAKPRLVIDGTCPLRVLFAGEPADVLVVSPQHNNGEEWLPTQLYRKDSVLTLVMQSWTDDRRRMRNLPSPTATLVRLAQGDGALKEGQYELRLVWRQMNGHWDNPTKHFNLVAERSIKVPFTVHAAGAKVEGNPASAAEADLKEVNLTEAARAQEWQRPVNLTEVSAAPAIRGNGPAAVREDLKLRQYEVKVGTFDRDAWIKPTPQGPALVPTLAAPEKSAPLYVSILGPELNSGEWMQLREILWNGRKVTIRLNLWTDSAPRKRNAPAHPLLVAPLEPMRKGVASIVPGDYEVEVEFTLLHAESGRKPYSVAKTQVVRSKFTVAE